MTTQNEDPTKTEADKEAVKEKKRAGFVDQVADKILEKQEAKEKAKNPPHRTPKPADDVLEDSSLTGDQDLDEFMFGEKPEKPKAGE